MLLVRLPEEPGDGSDSTSEPWWSGVIVLLLAVVQLLIGAYITFWRL